MSDPKNPKYEGTLRFDDDNIVEVGLEPDTENISVRLNGVEVTGGGSEEVFYVDFSYADETLQTFESSKTYAEIIAAVQSGAVVIGRFNVIVNNVVTNSSYYPLTSVSMEEGYETAVFTGFGSGTDNWTYVTIEAFAVTPEQVLNINKKIALADIA